MARLPWRLCVYTPPLPSLSPTATTLPPPSACTQYENLTSVANLKSLFARDRVKWPDLTWVSIDGLTTKGPPSAAALEPPSNPTAIAFLQYTSGVCALCVSHGLKGVEGYCACWAHAWGQV